MRHQSEVLQRVRSRLSVKRPSGYHEAVTRWQLRASRFKADVNHRIAKTTVAPGFLIGLEDLMHLRERTRTQGKHRHRKRPRAPLRNAVLCRLPIPNRRRINHPSIHPCGCGFHLPGVPNSMIQTAPSRAGTLWFYPPRRSWVSARSL